MKCENPFCPKQVGNKAVIVAIHDKVHRYCSCVCSLDAILDSIKEIELTIAQIRKSHIEPP